MHCAEKVSLRPISYPYLSALGRARSLQAAYDNGDDIKAREDMSIVSLFGGLALANAKLVTANRLNKVFN